jgi:LysM repeat protein
MIGKKKFPRWIVVLVILGLIIVCIEIAIVLFLQGRSHTLNSKPLVLIHTPINHSQNWLGEGLLVHATARQNNGLRRIELWVDNTLVDARDAPGGEAPTLLIFSNYWFAREDGFHELIVRAIAADGTEGQASITVTSLSQDEPLSAIHTVEEGETIESIAEEYSISPVDLVDANPEMDPSGPMPGDELTLPEEDNVPSFGGDEAPLAEEAPPLFEDEPPASFGNVMELLLHPFVTLDISTGQPTGLRVEFERATTDQPYEGLHCYIGLGEISPLWYPDQDLDQSTDESFVAEDGIWALATHLDGPLAPVVYWPRNRALPLNISCVGINAGGTQALDLGLWNDSIPPEQWGGSLLSRSATGADGSFRVDFRITRMDGASEGVPLILDDTMTPPTNAHLRHNITSDITNLAWSYNPPSDEAAIDGFRIFLNGTLQWVEPAGARLSLLPPQWYHPPCGSSYTFYVTAYRMVGEEIYESIPALASLEQPETDCAREIEITFLTLRTFDLGSDGNYEDRSGDVGPPYGYFFANERQVSFDGGSLGRGLDDAIGFSHYTTYDIGEIAANRIFNFNGSPSLVVDVPPGEPLEFGFHIMDEDSGRCHDANDPGCDDLICENWVTLYQDDPYISSRDNYGGELDQVHTGVMVSQNGKCEITYQIGPALGSPIGSGAVGDEPLPWLEVENYDASEDLGQVRIHVRNTGSATWANRDLNVELQTRGGESLGIFTWEDFTLEPGERFILTDSDMVLNAPYDACVLIDPFNEVSEEGETSRTRSHQPVCPLLPDLIISNLSYNSTYGQLHVTVQNIGDHDLENRTVSLETYLPDNSPLFNNRSFPHISIERGSSQVLILSGVDERMHQLMQGGYSVVVNPVNTILESNIRNNSHSVPATTQIRIRIKQLRVLYHYRESTDFYFTAYAGSGSQRRRVANYHFDNIDLDCDPYNAYLDNNRRMCYQELYPPFGDVDTNWFTFSGDETIEINVRSTHRSGYDQTLTYTWRLNDGQIDPSWGSSRDCNNFNDYDQWVLFLEPYDSDYTRYYDPLHVSNALQFHVCAENP